MVEVEKSYEIIYSSPIGELLLTSDGMVLTGVYFLKTYSSKVSIAKEVLPIFQETIQWLDQYFSGMIPDFTPKYRIVSATPFQKKVWDILTEIPYGKWISYNDIAKRIAKERGIPKMSAQAVGGAVGKNPIGIIIPCHRVLGKNGALTGYGGGIENKIELLKIEHFDFSNLQEFKLKME